MHAGVLIGAGSYGRVYKGRWCGRDVAVKVRLPGDWGAGVLCGGGGGGRLITRQTLLQAQLWAQPPTHPTNQPNEHEKPIATQLMQATGDAA